MNNIFNTYVMFNKKYLKDICNFVYKENENIIDIFLDNYINCIYYHNLETLEECKNFGLSTVKSELKGKYYEIVYDKLIGDKECYNCMEIVLFAIEISNINKRKDMVSIINKYNKKNIINIKKENYSNLYNIIEIYNTKLDLFRKKLKVKNYYLKYSNLDNDNIYITLGYNVSMLNKYNNSLINNILNNNDVYKKKLELEFDLLNIELITLINTKKHLKKYFIDLKIDNLKNYEKILEKINHKLSKQIILIIDSQSYIKYKNKYMNINENYSLAVLLNLKNINNINKKLEEYDKDYVFDYIIVNDYKDKDYNNISNYKFKYNTKLFIMERSD